MSFNRSLGGTRMGREQRTALAAGPLLLAAGALLLAACGGGSSNRSATATQPAATVQPSTTASGAAAPSAAKTTGATVVTVTTSQFGAILADAKGLALYTATGDTPSQSGCTGICLKLWPPLLLPAGQSQPVAGPGVSGLGTFMRPEGVQVTYHGKPLYTWIKDTRSGQVTGQGVVDSGGTWFVASVASASNPAATPSTAAPPATQAPASTPPTTAPGGGVSY